LIRQLCQRWRIPSRNSIPGDDVAVMPPSGRGARLQPRLGHTVCRDNPLAERVSPPLKTRECTAVSKPVAQGPGANCSMTSRATGTVPGCARSRARRHPVQPNALRRTPSRAWHSVLVFRTCVTRASNSSRFAAPTGPHKASVGSILDSCWTAAVDRVRTTICAFERPGPCADLSHATAAAGFAKGPAASAKACHCSSIRQVLPARLRITAASNPAGDRAVTGPSGGQCNRPASG
jgi:hypothetical protein